MDYVLLQHYWWAIISLLGALLVFLLFVQGGQSLLGIVDKTEDERKVVINSLGRKWEFTFTTLVTFGGAFFASFPLFYSTSFGGAYYVWMLILLVFVIQAVSYEFRSKAGNFIGRKSYDVFLRINGIMAPLLIGVAVGTFFTGADFSVDFARIGVLSAGDNIISQWHSPWHGLEALADYRNWLLGGAVLFLARSLGAQYIINSVDDDAIVGRARKNMLIEAAAFVVLFIGFIATAAWGILFNLPYLGLLLVGVVFVLLGFVRTLLLEKRNGIWFSGIGTIIAVFAMLLFIGYTGSYYPSTVDAASSLTIFNSSSSEFTLRTMAWVSIGIIPVAVYIFFAWRAMNVTRVTKDEVSDKKEHFY